MLTSFSVSGFKVFRHTEIRHLSQLNLFVGSNNAGKSCLLEAIHLWSANAAPAVIRELLRAHDPDRSLYTRRASSGEAIEPSFEAEDPIRFLFHDFPQGRRDSAFIEVGPLDDLPQVRLSLGKYREIRDEDGMPRRVPASDFPSLFDESESRSMLDVSIGKHRTIYPLDHLWFKSRYASPSSTDESLMRPLAAVGTGGVSSSKVALLWDKVSLTPEEDSVLDCLRLIDPSIEGLTLVADSDRYPSGGRVPIVRLRGNKGRFPLRAMGDGLTRLFHIALAMVNAKNGILLIDEFENGLYWEVQAQLWPVLFRLAAEFNVQVFSTSHSTDSVSSFVEAAKDNRQMGSLFRVDRSGDEVDVKRLPLISVADALSAKVEVR